MTGTTLALSIGLAAAGIAGTVALSDSARAERRSGSARQVQLAFSRIYWEYNASANDLGVHVTLDGEDWTDLEIENPAGEVIFSVAGEGPYDELGMTELFFEGAEPSLEDVDLEDLLDRFPEGDYEFSGTTVGGDEIEGVAKFTHAIPAGPSVSADVGANGYLRIRWTEVTSPPSGFPDRKIRISGYQVLVGSFQVTLPATARSVTVPAEFVSLLPSGEHDFEVLAIEAGGNQTITEGTFVK
jgi:hypothetical protein